VTQLQSLIEEIPKYQPGADLDLVQRAYRFSEVSHKGQQRASGEPYLSHPLEVASLLVNFKMDVTTVTAGLLHDVLEDTGATKADLEREFGKEIADLVDGVTKIGKLAFSSREERQAENFRPCNLKLPISNWSIKIFKSVLCKITQISKKFSPWLLVWILLSVLTLRKNSMKRLANSSMQS